MATKQFIFNTNVGITENYATNFFDVSNVQLTAKTDLNITSIEKCAEVLNEMATVYNEIQNYCDRNIDEKNIYTFASGLEDYLVRIGIKNITLITFTVSDLTNINSDFLTRNFNPIK